MTFKDDAQRKTAFYAGGQRFETWKDYSVWAATFYLPPSSGEYTQHPVDGFELNPGATFWNTTTKSHWTYDGTAWQDMGPFPSLTDTPADYNGAAGQSVVVKGAEDGLEFKALAVSDITDFPSTFPPAAHSHAKEELPGETAFEDENNTFAASNLFLNMPDVGPQSRPIVPNGGVSGQVLRKISSLDYDYEWQNSESGTFDPAAAYTITGLWDVQANWRFNAEITIARQISFIRSSVLRWSAFWNEQSWALQQADARQVLVAWSDVDAGGQRVTVGDDGSGNIPLQFVTADRELTINGQNAGAGAKFTSIVDNSSDARTFQQIKDNTGQDRYRYRLGQAPDPAMIVQGNDGVAGWKTMLTYRQDYAVEVSRNGLFQASADNTTAYRQPRHIASKTEPPSAHVEEGDVWYRLP